MTAKIKPMADLDRVRLASVIPLDMPFALYLFHSNVCNYRCAYCAHSLGREGMRDTYDFKPEIMKMEVFDRFADQLSRFPGKLKFLSFTGQGEPTVNRNLPELIRRIKQADVAQMTEVITNGSRLNPALCDALVESGLDRIKISVTGVTDAAFLEYAGVKEDVEEYVSNIRYLYERRGCMKVYVKVMDTSLKPGEDELFYEYFSEISDRMFIEKCRPVYPGVEYGGMVEEETMDRFGRAHEKRVVCPLCFFQLAVWPNGDVVPCDTILKPVVLGNVMNGSIEQMWNNEIHREFCKMQLRGERYEANPRCAQCVAPDDVCHPQDVLDAEAERILEEKF